MNGKSYITIALIILLIILGIIIYTNQPNGVPSEEEICDLGGGQWKEFPNACRDSCNYLRNPTDTMCAQVLTEGCDCPEGQCWDGVNCVSI